MASTQEPHAKSLTGDKRWVLVPTLKRQMLAVRLAISFCCFRCIANQRLSSPCGPISNLNSDYHLIFPWISSLKAFLSQVLLRKDSLVLSVQKGYRIVRFWSRHLMGKYIDYRVARSEADNTFWTDSTGTMNSKYTSFRFTGISSIPYICFKTDFKYSSWKWLFLL